MIISKLDQPECEISLVKTVAIKTWICIIPCTHYCAEIFTVKMCLGLTHFLSTILVYLFLCVHVLPVSILEIQTGHCLQSKRVCV